MVLKLPHAKPTKVKVADDQLWVQKDGTVLAVSDMTEQHAKNCLCLLIKKIREAKAQNQGKNLLKKIIKMKEQQALDDAYDPDDWGAKS